MKTLFEVKVDGRDTEFTESFLLADTTKLKAMKRALGIARVAYGVKGELLATAKVAREETFTPGICV